MMCNLLTANEFARRFTPAGDAVTSNAYDPGLMPGTALARDANRDQRLAWHYLRSVLTVLPGVRSTAASGLQRARLIDDPTLDDVSGRYFAGGREKQPSPAARDPTTASTLWRESAELVALTFPMQSSAVAGPFPRIASRRSS